MARKPNKPAELEGPQIDDQKIGGAMVVMRSDAMDIKAQSDMDVFKLGQQVGAVQMAQFQQEICATAQLRLFLEIKESKKYKDLAILHPDGKARPAQNIEEFCEIVFGQAYRVMAERAQNFEVLGEAMLESADRIGLRRQDLRMLRSLPADEQKIVDQAMQTKNRDEIIEIVQTLAERAVAERNRAAELEGDKAALEDLVTKKSKKIDQQVLQMRRIKIMPPDKVHGEIIKEVSYQMHDTLGSLKGQLRQGFLALREHEQQSGGDSREFLTGVINSIKKAVSDLVLEFDLPDMPVDIAPEWTKDGAWNNFGADDRKAGGEA